MKTYFVVKIAIPSLTNGAGPRDGIYRNFGNIEITGLNTQILFFTAEHLCAILSEGRTKQF